MKRFDGKCPACGSQDVNSGYRREPERLLCRCVQCQYIWNALPLFAEEAPEPASEPQPEADAGQVQCDSADYICRNRMCEHLIPHNRMAVCDHRCGHKYEAHCIPVPQPEPPPTPYHVPKLPMEVGRTALVGLWQVKRIWEDNYRLGYYGTGTSSCLFAPWSNWLTFARWIIEQEEARHAPSSDV